MKHYGDITQIKGSDVPPVDIIVGGSPCQDLSLAATERAGLQGERSGLFLEQVRLIKEMRDYDRRTNGRTGKHIRPRFEIWENVPGALFINDGEDFRTVLEQTARIVDSDTSIPRLPDGESWSNAGCILGNEWSIAWRVHNAEFWGVPQMRRRISLVADFGGHSAPEALFEREDKSRLAAPYGGAERDTAGRIDPPNKASEPIMIEMGSTKHTIIRDGICVTLKARMGTGGENVNAVIRENGIYRLSPLEIERLQGFPDGWTDIPGASDTARYKALGNSIALPQWQIIIDNMAKYLPDGATLGSLFDGIGGFPLCWERTHGKGTARWASEIEKFPIEVTKYHFPE